jgi:hypothetical protein
LNLRINFVEKVDLRELIAPSASQFAVINCDFAWAVRDCVFSEGIKGNNIYFLEEVVFSRPHELPTEFGGESTYLAYCVFHKNVYFYNSIFKSRTTFFCENNFCGPSTEFTGSVFHSNTVFFNHSTFKGDDTYFDHTKFIGEDTSFHSCTFSATRTHFNNAQFTGEEASFSANFNSERTFFDYCQCLNANLSFHCSAFKTGRTSFYDSVFDNADCEFMHANLEGGSVEFINTQFINSRPSFRHINFGKPSHLKFNNCKITDTKDSLLLWVWLLQQFVRPSPLPYWFRLALPKYGIATVYFEHVTIDDEEEHILIRREALQAIATPTDVDRYQFNKCHFRPNNVAVEQLDLNQLAVTGGNGINGFGFTHCLWPAKRYPVWPLRLLSGLIINRTPAHNDTKPTQYDDQRITYERLKQQAQDQGDQQLASDFYVWQLWFKYQSLGWWVPTDDNLLRPFSLRKAVLWFYCVTSAFGVSIVRPLLCLLILLFLACPLDYALLLGLAKQRLGLGSWDGYLISKGLQMALSHGNPLEGLNLSGYLTEYQLLHLPWWLTILFWLGFMLQNAVVLYLWFQLGAAIRNKVKR